MKYAVLFIFFFVIGSALALPAYYARWSFDNNITVEDNNLYNWSRNNATATSPNQSSIVRSGATGKSIEFDGKELTAGVNSNAPQGGNHFLYFPSTLVGAGDATIGFWIQLTNTSKAGAPFYERGTGFGSAQSNYYNNTGLIDFCSGSTCATSTSRIDDGKWHYYTGRKLSGTCSIWLDGVNQSQTACTTTTAMIRLGADRNNANIIQARIDDFVIYHVALTDAQISNELYVPYDSCTYGGAGNWTINQRDNCTITLSTDILNNTLIFNGTDPGRIIIATTITNVSRLQWNGAINVSIWGAAGITKNK